MKQINKDALKSRINKLERNIHIPHNTLYSLYFFDSFLKRLNKSKYKKDFVLKGGLYLSNVLGINNRTTMDLDFSFRNKYIEQKQIKNIVNEIINTKVDDGVVFSLINVKSIIASKNNNGWRTIILGKLENVRLSFYIDIVLGDPIIPKEKNFSYKCLITEESLDLMVYSLESVIAEKLETILSKNITNSRCKDYYDLYILQLKYLNSINKSFLKKAFSATCSYRDVFYSKKDSLNIIDEMKANSMMKVRWSGFTKNHTYARGVSFIQTLHSIEKWVSIITD